MALLNDQQMYVNARREKLKKRLMRMEREKMMTFYAPEQVHTAFKKKCMDDKKSMTDVLVKLMMKHVRV